MRIWSIHPKYLDQKGLVALWRESLLAMHVLQGKTQGYRKHPQLERFKSHENPKTAINSYLKAVFLEAQSRNYLFNTKKVNLNSKAKKINVTSGQIKYEFNHLKKKLSKRSISDYNKIKDLEEIEPHPLFNIISGKIENWEKVN